MATTDYGTYITPITSFNFLNSYNITKATNSIYGSGDTNTNITFIPTKSVKQINVFGHAADSSTALSLWVNKSSAKSISTTTTSMVSFTAADDFLHTKSVRAASINFSTKGYIDDIEVIYDETTTGMRDIYAWDTEHTASNNTTKWNQDNAYTSIHYWGGASSTNWPGETMIWLYYDATKKENLYYSFIPSGTTGIVFVRTNENGEQIEAQNKVKYQTINITDLSGHNCAQIQWVQSESPWFGVAWQTNL
jgi:hypothetical protein